MSRFPRAPTAKRIARVLGIDADKARIIRGLMDGSTDPLTYKSADRYSRACYSRPDDELVALYAIDEVLGTCGIDGFCDQETGRRGLSYCNTGDTYAPTVLLYYPSGAFDLGCWGDVAERHPDWS